MQRRVLSGALLFTLAGCGADGSPDRPDIVLVCIDTLRADHTSLQGYERSTTPELERVAAQGVWFERHVANASWTKPSVASMLTGLAPTAHGSRLSQIVHADAERGVVPEVELLSERHFTLPEVLAEHGYETCAHVTNYNMAARFGYAQGYDVYHFDPDATGPARVHSSDREAIEFAKDRLRRAEGPVFAWVHLMSVHQYAAPTLGRLFRSRARSSVDPEATSARRLRDYAFVEQAIDEYDDSVRFCDQLVGELWDWLQAERPGAVLIVTSDHGEEFFEHGGFEHGSTLYAEQLHIPLVIAGGGIAPARVDGMSDSLDLFPTVLTLAGIDVANSDLPGRSLLSAGALEPTGGKASSFSELHARGAWRRFAIIEEGVKLISSTRKSNDSHRIEFFPDTFGEEALGHAIEDFERVDRLLEELVRYQARVQADFERRVGVVETTILDDSEVDLLHGLGYAGGFEGDK